MPITKYYLKIKKLLPKSVILNIYIIGKRIIPSKIFLKLRYVKEYYEFKELGGEITHKFPIVSDYKDKAGNANGHYFHQDLLVASFIFEKNPVRHIDIGSRIDGFVAHIASFRKIDVMDIRDLPDIGHSNISFIKADLMDIQNAEEAITDSISCLHAIEHFGLGRYGDVLDPEGHKKGFKNILRMLKPGGTLYISFPIGKKNAVYFNAHREFKPDNIFTWMDESDKLELLRFDYVDDAGNLNLNTDLSTFVPHFNYGCGIYTFKKLV
jgi:hypothetical protein